MYTAIRNGNLEEVKNYTIKDSNMLHYACLYNQFEIVKYLVENGININGKTSQNNNALINAYKCGNHDIVKYLILKGIDLNNINSENCTILDYYLLRNNFKIIELLLQRNAKNHNTKEFQEVGTILSLCKEYLCIEYDYKLVKLLVRYDYMHNFTYPKDNYILNDLLKERYNMIYNNFNFKEINLNNIIMKKIDNY